MVLSSSLWLYLIVNPDLLICLSIPPLLTLIGLAYLSINIYLERQRNRSLRIKAAEDTELAEQARLFKQIVSRSYPKLVDAYPDYENTAIVALYEGRVETLRSVYPQWRGYSVSWRPVSAPI